MIGRTNVGGSGSGTVFAYIGVTYPAGSTLTCTNGQKTLRAKDTTGLYVFGVPYAGTWTVTATSGSQTASQNVTVSTLWEDKIVQLIYVRSLVIYNAGDQRTSVTGGWTKATGNLFPTSSWQNNGTVTIGNSSITLTAPSTTPSSYVAVRTVNAVNISDYTRMNVSLSNMSSSSGMTPTFGLYVGASATQAGYVGDVEVTQLDFTISFNSARSGNYYIFILCSNADTVQESFSISKLTLSE